MSEVEFLVKLRNAADKIMEGAALLRDGTNQYLETMSPVDVRDFGDFDTLKWTAKEGSKATYEQTSKEVNNNSKEFQVLQERLSEKGGFWQTKNYKFWFHRKDQDTIDRRHK